MPPGASLRRVTVPTSIPAPAPGSNLNRLKPATPPYNHKLHSTSFKFTRAWCASDSASGPTRAAGF